MVSEQRIALDSNAFTFLVDATTGCFHPADDTDALVAIEKVAMLRIFTYTRVLYYPPIVESEMVRIDDDVKWKGHLEFAGVLLDPIPIPDAAAVDKRASELLVLHPNEENDCRALAEAEMAGFSTLLTFDFKFLRRLKKHTRGVQLRTPSDHWGTMNVPRGQEPLWWPEFGNPLYGEHWWRWI